MEKVQPLPASQKPGGLPAGIEVIFFDIDGTLAETDDYYSGILQKALKPLLFFLSDERISWLAHKLIMFSQTPIDMFYWLLDKVGLDRSFTRLTEHFSSRESRYTYNLVADAHETLAALSPHFRLGIITAGGAKTAAAFLNRYQLSSFFEIVVTAQTVARTKPDPLPLLYAAEQLGVKPKACLMIGDTVFDLKTAQRAGAAFIGVRTGFDHDWLLKMFGAETTLDSVRSLPAFLGILAA